MIGQLHDWWTSHGGPSGNPPLQGDSHAGTSAFRYDADYVTVHVSVRGTGCSAGEFDLFSTRSALDGKEIIENWIVHQPWSNRKVGIIGHSYSGITGFMVAATQPKHLTSITVSGLIDDLYRGIVYPGGVSNFGFPLIWNAGIRNAYDVVGGSVQALARHGTNEIAQQCAKNMSTHRRTVLNDSTVQGASDTDNDWFRSRALMTHAPMINRPIHIVGAYQDEQTGARGPAHLWEKVEGTPKRLVLTNGDHGTNVSPDEIWQDRKAWMDYWMRGIANPFVADPDNRPTSVRIAFEMLNQPSASQVQKDAVSFPLEDTAWTELNFSPDGSLTEATPPDGTRTYFSGSKRQSWNYQAGPNAGHPFTTYDSQDELLYTGPVLTEPVAIAGPITSTLYLSTTATDTEMYVQLIDIDESTGKRSYLQRGLLRASHRAIDRLHSQFTADGRIYRPHRPHTNLQPVTPGEVTEYLVEIWPVGHIFRPGHRIAVKVMAPPAVDSYYVYVPKTPPGLNTLHHGETYRSRIMLPVVPLGSGPLPPAPACGNQDSVRCV